MMLLIVLFLLACGLVYLYLTHKLSYWQYRGVPHEKPNLFFGNVFEITFKPQQPATYFRRLYKKFEGPYFGFYAYTTPWLIVKDPGLIKRIMVQDSHVFLNRSMAADESIDPMHSNDLFGIKTPKWKPLRTKLSPVFTSGKIKAMLHLMLECGKNLKEYINEHTDKGVEVKNITSMYTIDLITSCAFGIAANSFQNKNTEFKRAAKKMFDNSFINYISGYAYFFAPLLVKIFRLKFINGEAATFLRKAFNETIKHRENSKTKRNDLIDILIELKNAETKDDEFKFYGDRLVAQAVLFFGAGNETSSSTTAFTIHELCINKEIQERLRLEINEIIEKYNGLTYEAVQDMKYLQMCLSETLRKYPLIPFLTRCCAEDYKVIETGLVIEKGTPIMIPQPALHWDPKYFPNPEVYDPERFSPENKQMRTNYTYLPFGEGPRNCIGERFGLLSAKIAIIHIMRNFSIERSPETREQLELGLSGIAQTVSGIYVTFKKLSE